FASHIPYRPVQPVIAEETPARNKENNICKSKLLLSTNSTDQHDGHLVVDPLEASLLFWLYCDWIFDFIKVRNEVEDIIEVKGGLFRWPFRFLYGNRYRSRSIPPYPPKGGERGFLFSLFFGAGFDEHILAVYPFPFRQPDVYWL